MLELSDAKQEMIIIENCENDSVQSGQFYFVSCGTDNGECPETTEEIENKQCNEPSHRIDEIPYTEEVDPESKFLYPEQFQFVPCDIQDDEDYEQRRAFSDAEISRLDGGDTLAHSGLLNCDLGGKKLTTISVCDLNKRASSKNGEKREFFQSGDTNYQCDVCLKTFSKQHHLESHKLYHIGAKLHLCDICNRAFTRAATLKTHKLIHTCEKRFKCDVCGKMFSQQQQLISHKISHSGVKKYKCHVCDKSFCHSSTLSRHKLKHSSVEKFVCEICNKVFLKSSSLYLHNLIHEKEI